MEKQAPFFTVLMPAYNAAPFLREAVDSVLAQTFIHFELLIINDGSTDETGTILASYADPRIRVFRQENAGVTGALNAGLKLATGTYIARFDADDICYPHRLQVQHDYLIAHPDCVLLGSASDYIDEEGNDLFEWQPDAYDHAGLAKAILHTSPFDHPTIVYPRLLALELGGYPAGAIHFEDHLFWTRFFSRGTVANLPQPLIKHRFNAQSVTIDERWRGPQFREIKYRSVQAGSVSPADAEALKRLLKTQDLHHYKKAAYHAMMGKKYLWNRPNPAKARAHLRQAMGFIPTKPELYALWILSFLPHSWTKALYRKLKQ